MLVEAGEMSAKSKSQRSASCLPMSRPHGAPLGIPDEVPLIRAGRASAVSLRMRLVNRSRYAADSRSLPVFAVGFLEASIALLK